MRFISENTKNFLPVWLAPEEINDPAEFIKQYCGTHSIVYCRFILWQMLSNSVSTENQHIDASPGEQLYFFENLMPLIEAVYLLQRESAKMVEGMSSETIIENDNNLEITEAKLTHRLNYKAENINFNKGTFKKKQKNLRKHSIWYREKINDPISVIANFFDAYSLTSFRTYLYEVLQTTSNDHFYQKGSPSDVLYVLEKLESLINAAYLINDENFMFEVSDTSEVSDTFNEVKTVHRNLETTPSMLSKEEIEDPKKVLIDFFNFRSLKEWKKELIEINGFALSKHPAQEWGAWIDSLSIFVYSIKLTEALFLISLCYDNRQE
ncbi:hypothetical protein [Dyadobacter frigoris]|uniref:Uncharacterized protein n=1 Tax=Dyadobacter frigoris TaxID=2576211 RepID=A0A4U6D991_9BACT|nr:hypothetical protein [Dyadobacter frigoris]TKT94049.1 hypothetical protein FDK13_02235 [Dyadobacter frigoris]